MTQQSHKHTHILLIGFHLKYDGIKIEPTATTKKIVDYISRGEKGHTNNIIGCMFAAKCINK